MSQTLSVRDNPYRKFTLLLGAFILVFTVVLSVTAAWVINHFVIKDSITFTSEAVQTHLSDITPLRKLFVDTASPDPAANAGEYANSETAHHEHGADGDAGQPEQPAGLHSQNDGYEWTESSLNEITGIVQMHFSLYRFESVSFYNKSGISFFSYDRSLINQPIAGEAAANFDKAWAGKPVSYREEGNLLHLWLPIESDPAGDIIGVVEIVRNISEVNREIRTIQSVFLITVLTGMLILFFSLRHIFINSTRTIDSKNQELGAMLGMIRKTYDESLQALSGALDLRDNETQGHSFRVTSYAYMLGKKLELSDDELSDLVRGALLHDVGKIGVPDRILLKPDRLNDEEWGVMKSHVDIGYNMLKHIEFLKPSLNVVLHHHERWDGSGYPRRLKGDEIPLSACIFSLCDTYDAMTSDRPYRKGRGYPEARAEIERHRGTQFNPAVVDAFLAIPEYEWVSVRESVTNSWECSLRYGFSGMLPSNNAAVS
jgi:HD-GYP domain-containing protein (c-di-GMP phosphodiesterase class II)